VINQKSSKHSPQEFEQSLRDAVQRHKFGILHVLDLKNTLHDKGIELDNEVLIYDVCNPAGSFAGPAPGHGHYHGAAVPNSRLQQSRRQHDRYGETDRSFRRDGSSAFGHSGARR
jgi:hypothetical protein